MTVARKQQIPIGTVVASLGGRDLGQFYGLSFGSEFTLTDQGTYLGISIGGASNAIIAICEADATVKADAAEATAIAVSAEDATEKADNAQASAIAVASNDATTKANAAQAAAQAASQPLDADLTAIAALGTTSYGRSFLDRADAASARLLLALGSAALQNVGAFDAAGAAAAAQAASQPLDSDLTAIAALTTTAFGRSFLTQLDSAAARALLALGTAAVQNVGAFDAAGAAAAAQLASQPLDADLTAIAALATTAYGRSLLTAANQAALQLQVQTGWQTAHLTDFTTQATQAMGANGNYVINGITWQRQNAVNDKVAMALTNGTGLVIKAASGVYDGTTRTAPLIWTPLSSFFSAIPNFDISMKLRIWIQALDSFGSGGVFNAGDAFAWGIDSNSFAMAPYLVKVAPLQTAQTTRRFTMLAASTSTPRMTTSVDQTVAATVMNIGRLDTDELWMPGRMAVYWDKSSANFPLPTAASIRPVNQTSVIPSTVAVDYPTQVNTGSNQAFFDQLGIVIAAMNGGANDLYNLVVQKLRIDYKL